MTLTCCDLFFSYERTETLADINMEVPSGNFCASLGRNGSGKTTLLHCINGLLYPNRGLIELDGLSIIGADQKEIAKRVSMVPQKNIDIFPFSVEEVVVMGRTPYLGFNESPGPADYDTAFAILESLDAGYLAKRNFNRISGGERRISLLARALMQSTKTLLFDEPTNHLDFHNQYRILSMMRELCRKKGSRIIASMHDPNLVNIFADQVIMLKKGRILEQGPTEKVMTADFVGELYDTNTKRF
ncbi:MAG: ABC transporter ATP-binding protein [Deltaproteobacteria bacterium]|nr:ABC transporter ATP-binding protein [Deltaproteobacteria bacterium]